MPYCRMLTDATMLLDMIRHTYYADTLSPLSRCRAMLIDFRLRIPYQMLMLR